MEETVLSMEPIENREVRGFNVKNIVTLVACTASIVATTIGSYQSLKAQISDVQTSTDSQIKMNKQENASDWKYNDLKMKTIELSIATLELQIKELKDKK